MLRGFAVHIHDGIYAMAAVDLAHEVEHGRVLARLVLAAVRREGRDEMCVRVHNGGAAGDARGVWGEDEVFFGGDGGLGLLAHLACGLGLLDA